MNERNDSVYLQHIFEACRRLQSYTADLSQKEFEENELVQDAVLRQLQVLGEAVKRLSEEVRGTHDHVPWRKIAGMRDKVVHDYMGIDLRMAWTTVQKDVPDLHEAVTSILQARSNGV